MVEQRTENPRVGGSTPPLPISEVTGCQALMFDGFFRYGHLKGHTTPQPPPNGSSRVFSSGFCLGFAFQIDGVAGECEIDFPATSAHFLVNSDTD